jgi:hypothetical protein
VWRTRQQNGKRAERAAATGEGLQAKPGQMFQLYHFGKFPARIIAGVPI